MLKVVSATFLLVCFICVKKSTFETRKNVFYFTLKALVILEISDFDFLDSHDVIKCPSMKRKTHFTE